MAFFTARRLWLCMGVCAALHGCGGGADATEPRVASSSTAAPDAKARRLAGVLDTSHWPAEAPYSFFTNFTNLNPRPVMQPFKPATTGLLTRVSLNLCVTGHTGTSVIQIRRAADFQSPVIATARVPRSSIPLFGSPACPNTGDMLASGQVEVSFDLQGRGVPVTAGEQLSITLVKTDGSAANDIWFMDFNGDRSARADNWLVVAEVEGSRVDAFGFQLRYRTYVAPAAP